MSRFFMLTYCTLLSRLYMSFASCLFSLTLLSACVSLKLSPQTQRSNKVDYKSPEHPFAPTQSESADVAWIDQQTGNIISYQSICNESLDPDLDTILKKSTLGLTNKRILKRTSIDYNARKANRISVSGQVDGVDVRLEFVLFKKNACSYTLSFVGLPEHFNKAIDAFNQFVEGFKVK